MRILQYVPLAFLALASISPSFAQADNDFYKGKTISLVVSSSSGGGYDTLARLLARHLPKHIAGQPNVVVQNMPGAGGLTATNWLYNVAARDGTVMATINNNIPFEPLLGAPGAKFDPVKFSWLGSPSVESGLLVVWKTVTKDTVEKIRQNELTVGSTGANSSPSYFARLMNEALQTKLRIVVGYPGQTEAFLAMERGEIEGYPSAFYSTVLSTKPDWLKDGTIKVVLQYGPKKEADLPHVPFAPDLATSEENRLLLAAGLAPLALGRPFLMPPETPADRLSLMRKAFMNAIDDPEFLAQAKKAGVQINARQSGADLQQVIENVYRTPPNVIERLRALSTH